MQHRLAVLEHVADTGRRARIVFEHVEFVVVGPHEVDADDMGIDPAGWMHADHLGQKGRVLGDHLLRETPGLDDFLPPVDVVQERVDRAHPLFDPTTEFLPFALGDDARHDVEGDEPFLGLLPSVDVEGDARQPEQIVGLALFRTQSGRVFAVEPGLEICIGVAKLFVPPPHFVEDFFIAHTVIVSAQTRHTNGLAHSNVTGRETPRQSADPAFLLGSSRQRAAWHFGRRDKFSDENEPNGSIMVEILTRKSYWEIRA